MNVIKVNKTNVKGGKREVALIEPLPYVNMIGKPASKLFARTRLGLRSFSRFVTS